jgi:hypothetical protein
MNYSIDFLFSKAAYVEDRERNHEDGEYLEVSGAASLNL